VKIEGKQYEMRQLVEHYYDIQKLRVEAFNRIVSFIREHKDEIKSQFINETHRKVASQNSIEPHKILVSQYELEPQQKRASQSHYEHQNKFASHCVYETHKEFVSHVQNEPQKPIASHCSRETQRGFASHRKRVETQFKSASHYENETHGDFVNHRNIETQPKNASHPSSETQDEVASLIEKKKYSEVARLICKGKFNIEELDELVWFHNKLLETEKEIYKRLDLWSKEFEIRKRYLNHIKGIGPVLASGLIAWLYPIERFPKVSKLWSYCGLAPGQKRKRGEKLNYNPRLKTLCWKIWNSFVKVKGKYREFYLKFKEDCKKKHPDWTKLHIHNYAGRKTVKLFLSHLWETWRKLEGLPVTEPYPIQILGHSEFIPPFTDK